MKYLYVHINNDFSGSTYAMKAIIESHQLKNYFLMTNFKEDGFLEGKDSQVFINVPYSFLGKGLKTIFQIIRYSFLSTLKLLKLFFNSKIDVVYVNTILPWTSSLLGKVFGKKIIYHVHEFYVNPSILVKFYLFIMKLTADEIVYVSDFTKNSYFIYDNDFLKINHFIQFTPVRFSNVNFDDINYSVKFSGPIVMVSAAKKYKGVELFLSLSKKYPDKSFKLYINDKYDFNEDLPSNFEVFVKHCDIQRELFKASVCLNLSQQPDWVETFGLTIWEALTQGTPVIVPDVGGPLEIIDNKCGIFCDVRELNQVSKSIDVILANLENYSKYSKYSLSRSRFLKDKNKIPNLNKFKNHA